MGRLSPEVKQQNRQRIVDAAAAGFKKYGIDAFGIDEVMKAAGMTHGGFYNHFASKEALVAAVCDQTFLHALDNLDALVGAHPQSARAAFEDAIGGYLSGFHRDHPEAGCPSAAMVADAGRRDVGIQSQYNTGLVHYLDRFESLISGAAAERGAVLDRSAARAEAIGVLSRLVGGLLLSRAVALANPELSDEVLQVNRDALVRIREGE